MKIVPTTTVELGDVQLMTSAETRKRALTSEGRTLVAEARLIILRVRPVEGDKLSDSNARRRSASEAVGMITNSGVLG